RLVSPDPLQTYFDDSPAASVLVVVEKSEDPIVDLDRQIVTGLFDVLFDLLLELRIDQSREGFDVQQVLNGSGLVLLVREAVSLPQRRQFHRIDACGQIR